ncbi:hypothetical protein [Actinoplanes sp. NBRC 103695]|uniref:hypothetical protein n=1 Tax=Actinoplanes sp. NBRC 103695 TaxID=3032202 RepID=UPI0024A2C049|nr:hypothetical protein [Actinoplanes sp. NBRC 103695]GLZ02337.1 hypothetical protein Acsp02_95880 [Actinoplanes sp. NBRC 103695]
MLLHNDTLPTLTQFWKAAATLAAGRSPAEADVAVLQRVFAETPDEPGVPADNQISMTVALVCGDATASHDIAGYKRAVAADRRRFPLTAGTPANIWPCAFRSRPIEPPVKVTAHGARNLILQNRRDHATP